MKAGQHDQARQPNEQLQQGVGTKRPEGRARFEQPAGQGRADRHAAHGPHQGQGCAPGRDAQREGRLQLPENFPGKAGQPGDKRQDAEGWEHGSADTTGYYRRHRDESVHTKNSRARSMNAARSNEPGGTTLSYRA